MPLTPERYLEIEQRADWKSEYFEGGMYEMPRADESHCLISGNAQGELHQQLRKGPCTAYSSDMRILVTPSGFYTYPDAVVVCGKAEFLRSETDTLLNPTVIVEVLSKATEAYDRGLKFKRYRNLPSLKQYLLISSEYVGVDLFTSEADGRWLLTSRDKLEDTLELSSIQCRLTLADIYHKVY